MTSGETAYPSIISGGNGETRISSQEVSGTGGIRHYLLTGGAQARIDQSDNPTFPRVTAGVATFDGKGNILINGTQSHGGEIQRAEGVPGTYTLNSDCTGTMDVHNTNWDIFITRDGREGATIRSDDGTIATRYIKKR